MQAANTPSLGYLNLSSGKKDIQEARELALVSLVAPVLFMASLVTAAVLFMSDITESGLFDFWLTAHILLCGALFLLSSRERAEVFEGAGKLKTLTKSFSFVMLCVAWSVVPGFLAIIRLLKDILFSALFCLDRRSLPRSYCNTCRSSGALFWPRPWAVFSPIL